MEMLLFIDSPKFLGAGQKKIMCQFVIKKRQKKKKAVGRSHYYSLLNPDFCVCFCFRNGVPPDKPPSDDVNVYQKYIARYAHYSAPFTRHKNNRD